MFFNCYNDYKRCMVLLLLLVLQWVCPVKVKGQNAAPQSLFLKMINAIDKVQTARYQLVMTERIKDDFITNKYLDKVQMHPLKVYAYSLTNNPGAEVLYVEGANDNKVLVKPNHFPWINLNLSPKSMLIRKDHLFTLDQSGFSYISMVLQHYYHADSSRFLAGLKLMADTIFDGKLCYRLVLNYPEFKWHTYTVKKNETFTSIADKFFLNDYMIMERNGKTSFTDLHEGQKIILPTVFVKKIILTIDKNSYMPVQQILYDDKGLLAVLEFRNLIINHPIPAEEFTAEYKGYGF